MAGVSKLKIKYSGGVGELTQTLDLKKLTGVDTSISPSLQRAIATEVIDYMVARTQSGIDKNGRGFKGYSKSYKNSLNFKAAEKSNEVNLTLSGDMLDAIDLIQTDDSKVTVGIVGGDESARAHGHQTGGGNLPKRQFFGISENEFIDNILPKFQKELSDLRPDNGDALGTIVNLIRNISDL